MYKELSEFYEDDPCAPGVLVSWLPEKRQYYCAISRYRGAFGTKREILCKAYSCTAETARYSAMTEWRKSVRDERVRSWMVTAKPGDRYESPGESLLVYDRLDVRFKIRQDVLLCCKSHLQEWLDDAPAGSQIHCNNEAFAAHKVPDDIDVKHAWHSRILTKPAAVETIEITVFIGSESYNLSVSEDEVSVDGIVTKWTGDFLFNYTHTHTELRILALALADVKSDNDHFALSFSCGLRKPYAIASATKC